MITKFNPNTSDFGIDWKNKHQSGYAIYFMNGVAVNNHTVVTYPYNCWPTGSLKYVNASYSDFTGQIKSILVLGSHSIPSITSVKHLSLSYFGISLDSKTLYVAKDIIKAAYD